MVESLKKLGILKIVGLFFFEIVSYVTSRQKKNNTEDRRKWLIRYRTASSPMAFHDRARHREARRGLARRFDPSLASQHMTGHDLC